MTNPSTPWLWALAAVFVSGVSVGTVVTMGSGWGKAHPAAPAPHPRDAEAGERSSSLREPRSELAQEPVRGIESTADASQIHVCDGDDCFEGVGESASEILRRLEEAYRAQLERANVAADDEAAVSEETSPVEPPGPTFEANGTALAEAPTASSEESADSSPELRLAERSPTDALEEDSLLTEEERMGPPSDGPSSVDVRVETLAQQIHQTNNQLVLVQAPTWVATMGPASEASEQAVDNREDGDRTAGASAVFVGSFGAAGPRTLVPRPLNSASSRSRVRPSTPQSSLGKSPWAPIDMSGQHNPWQSSQLP